MCDSEYQEVSIFGTSLELSSTVAYHNSAHITLEQKRP